MNKLQFNNNIVANYLNTDKYIISNDLENSLVHETQYLDINDQNSQIKIHKDTYLVMFRVVDYKKKYIAYNYIHYPSVFTYTLLYYLTTRNNVLGNIYKEPGFFLTVIEDIFIRKNQEKEDRLCLSKATLDFDNLMYDLIIYEDGSFLYEETFKLINKLLYITSSSEVNNLVNLAFNKDYDGFIDTILSTANKYNELKVKLASKQIPNLSIINSCLFVINNLNDFIQQIRNNDLDVNAGPQKDRGEVNSIGNFLSLLDMDYRKSLFNHNNYHTNRGYVNSRHKLEKSKFSFSNIHLKIGKARFYSTKNRSTTTKMLMEKQSFENEALIFNQLGEYLKNLPVNEKTQITIENFLLDYSSVLLQKKQEQQNNTPINYNLISGGFTNLLKEKEADIILYYNKLVKRKYTKKPTKKKDLALYNISMIFKSIDVVYLCSIINGRMLRIVNINNKLDNVESKICLDLGRDLVKNYYYSQYNNYKTNNKLTDYTLSEWKLNNASLINEYSLDDDQSIGYIGGCILSLMADIYLTETQYIRIGRNDSVNIVIPSKEVHTTLNNINSTLALPHKMPMIVKPKLYQREVIDGHIKERLGGYLLNDDKYTDELIIPKWNLKEPSVIKEKNNIYDLVNNINSVGYKINKQVLSFIESYADEHNLLYEDDYSELLSKAKLNKTEHSNLESYLSKKRLQENILGLSKAYTNVHEFYLPVRIDYRGRLYCVSEYLNYQSNELAKSLLLFSKPEFVLKSDSTSISYLKAYGANCFGNKLDKKSWNERIKWVDDNIDNIINFDNGYLLKQSENKLLFIAFCFEYKRYIDSLDNNESIYFETYLPVRLDASCNGYQHLALLSLDHNLAKELNLTKSNWNDIPKDFYSYVGACLINLYSEKLKSDISKQDIESYTRLISLDILRSLLKNAIMTSAYNISPLEMIRKMQENFELSDNEPDTPFLDRYYHLKGSSNVRLKQRDFILLRAGLEEILNNDDFKLKKLMKYLNGIAKVLTKLNLVISWGSPSGIEVNQSFLSTEEVRLKPFSYTKRTFSLVVPNKDKKINKSKQIRGFMPNLVHSLDSASLALLVDLYFTNYSYNNSNLKSRTKNMFSVHDCFAVTANNVEYIMDLLKLVYMKIYSETNYLRKLDRGIKDYIKLNYGDDCFNEKTLEIKTDDLTLQFPSIEGVLGTDASAANLILETSYIAH